MKGKMRTFNTHTDTTIFKWVAFNSLTCPRKLQTSGKKLDDARTEGRIYKIIISRLLYRFQLPFCAGFFYLIGHFLHHNKNNDISYLAYFCLFC